MKKFLVIACEALRTEIEHLVEQMPDPPEIIYMEQQLHDIPDDMRRKLQDKISEIEAERPDIERIVMAYGLCGRGTCGVSPGRVELVYPRVHDCIPLYMGVPQEDANSEFAQNGTILWLSGGVLEYGRIASHMLKDRHRLYAEKFGEAKAAKMIKAENALFANYKGARHIKWDGMKKDYSELAKALATEINLEYTEMRGSGQYMAELLAGGEDPGKFLTLLPDQTLDMDTSGRIVDVPLKA